MSYEITKSRIWQWLGIIVILGFFGGAYWYFQSEAAQTTATNTSAGRPDFEAPLTTHLNLTAGQGSATYSRADGADRRATVTDFEGLIRSVKAGEARFEGARRVENLVTNSEDRTTVWANSSLTASALGVGPNNYNLTKLTLTGGSVLHQSNRAYTAPDNALVWSSVYVDVNGMTTKFVALQDPRKDGTYALARVTWTSATTLSFSNTNLLDYGYTIVGNYQAIIYIKYNVLSGGTSPSSLIIPGAYGAYNGDGQYISVSRAMVEDVTGQANQNPSEYVSTNVRTASPYHGAGVDGVKYFATENGNTVASNVVTEATGTAISDTTLKGYLSEGARTNLVFRSEAFDNASWTKNNTTIATDSIVAPSGQTTAETLTASAIDGTTLQAITGTATSYTFSVFLKRLTGTGAVSISADGTSFTTCTVSSTVWTRCSDTRTLTVASYNQTIKIATSGDAVYAWGAQSEAGLFISSYIPTTSASTTRASDSLKYSGAGNFNDTAGTTSADVTTNWSGGSGVDAYFMDDSATYQRMALWHWNGLSNHMAIDRTSSTSVRNNFDDNSGTITTGVLMRLAQRWSGTAHSLFRDGALRGSDTTLTLPYAALSGIAIGQRGDVTTVNAYATIKNVRSWKRAMSDTFLNNLTAGQSGVIKQATNKTTNNTGLVGYWSFEDGSGTKATDFSGSNNTGTLTNGPTWVDGRLGKAVSFDGTNDYVNAGSATTLDNITDLTACAWIYPETVPINYAAIISKGWEFEVINNGSRIGFYRPFSITPVSWFAPTNSVSFNVWQHVCVSYNNSSTSNVPSFYVNGVLVSSTSATPVGTASSDAAYDVNVGAYASASELFDGSIDEVRVYNRILTQDEITRLYQVTSTKINYNQNDKFTSGLVGLWSFNGPDVSGTTAYDRSGSGNNGTLTNSPTVTPGKIGQALSFDGSNQYVDLATLPTAVAPYSVSLWMRPTGGLGSEQSLVSFRGVNTYPRFQISVNNKLLAYSGPEKYKYGTKVFATADLNNWWHVVFVVADSSTLTNWKVYVNGVDDSGIAGANTGTYYEPVAPGAIGNDLNSKYFMGAIDDVRLYNRALTATEALALYNSGQ